LLPALLPALLQGLLLLAVLVPAGGAGAAPAPASPAAAPTLQPAIAAFDAFEVDRAAALLTEFEKARGTGIDTLYYRTRIATLRNDPATARRHADQCVQRFPTASRCHEALAEARIAAVLSSGNPLSSLDAARAAKAAWAKAVQLDPRNTRAALLLLRYCRQAPWVAGGSESEARRIEASLQRVNAAAGHQARALNLLADERFDQAIAAFDAAIAADPRDRDPRIYRALALNAAKRWPEAARYTEELVRRYPKFWDGWLLLAVAHQEGKLDVARGLVAARTFVAGAGNRAKPQLAQAQSLIGALLERGGDRAGARTAYQQALRLHDDNKVATEGLERLGENCC
jgi:tetratricopeptide (TPR) repeat protein